MTQKCHPLSSQTIELEALVVLVEQLVRMIDLGSYPIYLNNCQNQIWD